MIHNVELRKGKGGQMVRTAGGAAQLVAKEGDYAQVKLPSFWKAWGMYEEAKASIDAWDFADALSSYRNGLQTGKLKESAPSTFLAGIKQQIHRRSRGRFFGRRWLLFGRIPFEWVSLATIVLMLIYFIIYLQGSPTGVRPAP